ncbi:MAG: cation-transporting P-type ATPase, partial [Myxococcota bacterium]|nr:cation-transporting P-type ATPase [Myxococcota bacterium]
MRGSTRRRPAEDATPAGPPTPWHARSPEQTAEALGAPLSGLGDGEAAARLRRFGPNRLEPPRPPSRLAVLARQFRSPLIYVLLVESGDRVPADLRLVDAQGLRVDESVLTGESVPVDKEETLLLPD